ncbi:AMP-binding enzyme domain-containing protein [Toxoplasma gondii GAB2-2007-GAL-DOM2]|uniref:AMP-binding enzyme domain-containing protein n=1 Tax=Toxoplasma gondii GAB2-2007-GAL-DOM2 TaxID=1130820 RepID=A0A086KBV8_TOXGO|nr:AMP-binding enzyme domain-containing protein [Toxoplasma gondii GAB2-2007-GAL-DOM2]
MIVVYRDRVPDGYEDDGVISFEDFLQLGTACHVSIGRCGCCFVEVEMPRRNIGLERRQRKQLCSAFCIRRHNFRFLVFLPNSSIDSTSLRISACLLTHINAYLCIHTRTYIYIYIILHMYMFIYIYIYIYMFGRPWGWSFVWV